MACRWRQGGRVATTPTVTFCRTALPLAKSPELRARDVSRAATVSQTVARKEIEFSVEYQVDAKIVKKEAELKAVRDRLKDTVSLRTDTEAELDRPDLSAAEKARLERVWTRLCGREDHLRKDKKFLLSGLRDLLDVGDNVEPVVDVQLKLESVNLKIDEKQKELDVVQADLEAIWQEQDDAKRVMRRREPTADHAYLDRVEMAVDRVEACLQEDKEYTQFVLQVFDAQANVLLRMLKQLRQDEPVKEVVRRLSYFVRPNPAQTWLSVGVTGHKLTAAAIKVLFELRTDARATGFVTGAPGRGKTMFLQQLLRSIDVEHLTLVPGLSRTLRNWWTTVPVGVVSFNGLSPASVEDHLLAWLDARLPLLVRIIFTETWDPADPHANFAVYRAKVIKLLKEKKLDVVSIESMASKVVRERMPASTSEEMRGVLLVDELSRLSLSSLSEHELGTLAKDIEDLRHPGVTSPQEEATTDTPRGEATADALDAEAVASSATQTSVAATAATATLLATSAPVGAVRTADVASVRRIAQTKVVVKLGDTWQPEDPAMKTAEAVRKAICDWCDLNGIRPVMTAFNERFIERQAGKLTGSLSNVRELVHIPLLPAAELIDQQQRRLDDLGFYLRTTSAAGQRRRQRSDTTARHLERLTLGHPRAAVVLDNAIQQSNDGDVFESILTESLKPSRLSVAKVSIEILARYPILMAAGLLNYDLPSSGFFSETLSYDTVFGEGALFKRSRLTPDAQGSTSRPTNPAIIVTFFLSAIALQRKREPEPALVDEYCDDDLLGHVWRLWRADFNGIDGIMFLRCIRGTRHGPRKGELVAVAMEFKSGSLKPSEDFKVSCSALSVLFGDLGPDWKRRTALVMVVREKAPVKLDVRTYMPELAVDSAIIVDADSLENAY
eukprot:contig_23221_g5735